jgi:hypothetical protein
MNPSIRLRLLPVCSLAGLVLAAVACQNKKPTADEAPPSMHRAAPLPAGGTQTVLRKTFPLSAAANFPFEVPAHLAMPHLHGNYKSFTNQLGVQSNDDTANVDFLILSEDQYADFVHGHAGEAIFSADASHDQEVSLSLPFTQDQPGKYYLVFRNPAGVQTKKIVQADFTLDF